MSKVLKFPEKFNTKLPENSDNSEGYVEFSATQYHAPNSELQGTKSLNTQHSPPFDVPDVTLAELKKFYPLEYNSWHNMKYQRCGPKGGYTLHPDFTDFRNFLRTMGPKPAPDYTLDRIDPSNVEYSPSNCRWASKQLQAENRSCTRYLTANGECLSVSEWSRRTGIPRATILNRVDRLDWTEAEAVESVPRTTGTNKRRARVDPVDIGRHPALLKFRDALYHVDVRRQLPCGSLADKLVTAYVDENPEVLEPDDDGYQLEVETIASHAFGALRTALLQEVKATRSALLSGDPLPPTEALDFIRSKGAGVQARRIVMPPATAPARRKTLVLPADHQPEQEEAPPEPAPEVAATPKRQWFRRKESAYHEPPLNLKIPDWEDLQNKKRGGLVRRLVHLFN